MAEAISTPEDEDHTVDLDNGQKSGEEYRCQICFEINRKILIECNQCGNNYHRSCVKIKKKQAEQISLYSCPPCRSTNPHNREPQNGANQTNHHFDFLQHLASCKSNLSLLGNIPRGARITAAEALNDLINDVIRTDSSLA